MSQSKKQSDLQGIRGLAIIAVLGFHFYPNYFPNGYLGVDQFFVLSGYLMCMLLTRSSKLPVLQIVTTFYSRRFKRILPLYLLFIASTLISLYAVFPDVAKRKNLEAAPRAMLFASNQPKTDEDDYFEMLEVAVDVFTHTWSLSVEIQFYVVIPVLFIVGNYLLPNFQIFYFSFIALLSFGFNFVLEQNVAFNSMFARIWQFMIGMIIYTSLLEKPEEKHFLPIENVVEDEVEETIFLIGSETEKKSEIQDKKSLLLKLRENISISTILFISCCSIIFCPRELAPEIFRPLATLLTGLLMYFAKDNQYLSNEKLTYIGDISYSLYLIHWPLYAYWKLVLSNNQYALFDYLLFSIVLASITFEYFEKWYLTLSSMSVSFLIVFLLSSNIFLLWEENKMVGIHGVFARDNYDAHIVQEAIKHMNLSETNEINLQWNADDMLNLRYEKECVMKDKSLFGVCDTMNLKKSRTHRQRIFIFGNSWATNHYRLIHDECSKNSNAIRMAALSGCEPLTVYSTPNHCFRLDNKEFFFNSLKEFQPDYAFYFARPITFYSPLANNVTNLDDDPNYKPAEKELLRMLPFVKKKIFILDAVPNMDIKGFRELGEMLQNGYSKDKIDKLLLNSDHEGFELAKKRYAKLIESCGSKCEKIDYSREFWNPESNSYRFYDKYGLEYLTVGLHLSPHGLQKVRHIYTDICKKME